MGKKYKANTLCIDVVNEEEKVSSLSHQTCGIISNVVCTNTEDVQRQGAYFLND